MLLRGPEQIDRAITLIGHVPVDNKRPLELVIREEVKVRGLDANGYYWLRLGELSAQAWLEGRQFNTDTWHEFAKRNIMAEEIMTKDGAVRSKWIEGPDGFMSVISTTQLERGCFADYTTAVEAFGANLGVKYSANPKEKQ